PATAQNENLTQDSHSGTVAVLNAVSNLPLAKHTVRTPTSFANGTLTDAAARFARQVDTVDAIKGMGDYHVDLQTGVISVYATATLGGGNIYTVTYSHYDSAPTGSNVSKFACALRDLKPGAFLKCNADSNF